MLSLASHNHSIVPTALFILCSFFVVVVAAATAAGAIAAHVKNPPPKKSSLSFVFIYPFRSCSSH